MCSSNMLARSTPVLDEIMAAFTKLNFDATRLKAGACTLQPHFFNPTNPESGKATVTVTGVSGYSSFTALDSFLTDISSSVTLSTL